MGKKQPKKNPNAGKRRNDKGAGGGGGGSSGDAPGGGTGARRRRSTRREHWSGGGGGDLEGELAAVRLRVHEVEGDGNCLFRAVLDQMQVGGATVLAAFGWDPRQRHSPPPRANDAPRLPERAACAEAWWGVCTTHLALQGAGGDHLELRHRVVEHMRQRADQFEPFV